MSSSLLKDSSNELQNLLQEFNYVFQEPQGLPPLFSCDHLIILEGNTKAVVVRPYCYPYSQKAKIESQCAAMLR